MATLRTDASGAVMSIVILAVTHVSSFLIGAFTSLLVSASVIP